MTTMDTHTTDILTTLGKEIRTALTACGLTQQNIADFLGWAGRDAASKLERGEINITLTDYVRLMSLMQGKMPPAHPGVALARYLRVERVA